MYLNKEKQIKFVIKLELLLIVRENGMGVEKERKNPKTHNLIVEISYSF